MRPDESLIPLARRLAALYASEEGTLALAAAQRLSVLAERGPNGAPAPTSDPGSLRVGIWEPETQLDGSVDFVRSDRFAEHWRFWADVERLPSKAGRRVVLLGESVARGYLYDPIVTPAGVLETMLRTVPGLEDAEVLDLARTDHIPDSIQTMFDPLPAVEPDAVVLFAGNAWHNVPLDLAHLQELADALRAGGYAALRQVVRERIILPRARTLLDALAESVAPFEIPVVVVVPEFNLRDWRSEPQVLAPVLRGDGNVRWMGERAAAVEALATERFADAELHARRMAELDEGTSSLAQDLLAEALLGLGRTAEAQAALEASRDAPYGLFVAHSPRTNGAIQEVMREKAREHGFALVDVPRILAERDLVANRELLLDYCHLTLAGMRLAMAAVAEAVAPLLGAAASPARELEDVELEVAPEDEALAHLLAAIHNAHWGQRHDVVAYHARCAVELAPQAAPLLQAYADAQSRAGESWLTEAFTRLTEAPNAERYLTLADPRHLDRLADFELVDAVADALEIAGVPARAEVNEILRTEEGGKGNVDLLASRYCASAFRERAGYSFAPHRAYLRALDTRSRFFLVRADSEQVTLTVTARLPYGEGEVWVRVNGEAVGSFAATREWTTHELALTPGGLGAGVNRLELEWPLLPPPSAELIEEGARALERGTYPEPLPAYGELHTLRATASGRRGPPRP